MKKLLYLFILSTFLISCDSNEEEPSELDVVIGKWELTSEMENEIEISTECSRKTNITFLENGTASETSYYDNGNSTCDSDTSTVNWENVGDSNYRIFIVSQYEDENTNTSKLSFSENNTVFNVTLSETYNDTEYTLVFTYKRI